MFELECAPLVFASGEVTTLRPVVFKTVQMVSRDDGTALVDARGILLSGFEVTLDDGDGDITVFAYDVTSGGRREIHRARALLGNVSTVSPQPNTSWLLPRRVPVYGTLQVALVGDAVSTQNHSGSLAATVVAYVDARPARAML